MGKTFKWVASFFIILIGLAYFQAQKLLMLTDLSTMPIDLQSNPDFKPGLNDPNRSERPPVYLITYAAGGEVYFQNQHALTQSAMGRGVDFILNYRRSLLDPNFIEKNRDIMDSKKGAGFWLWKPWIILHTMEQAPENAVIIYADGGCIIKGSIEPLIQRVQKDPILLSVYDMDPTETAHAYVKRSIYEQLNLDYKKLTHIPPLFAAFIVLRNTPLSRKFIKNWLNQCENKDLLMDVPSKLPEYPGYKMHFHDQSILNAIRVKYPEGVQYIKYKSDLLKNYINWAHRRPGAVDIDTSLVTYYGYLKMRKYDRIFFNSPPLKWYRKWIREKRENF